MVAMGDIRQNRTAKRAALLREIELVEGAIQRSGENKGNSEVGEEWLEKLHKWRDDLEELLLNLPDLTA